MGVQLSMKLHCMHGGFRKLRCLPQLLFNLKIKSPSPLYFEIVCPNLGFTDSAMLADQSAPKDTPISVFSAPGCR